MIKIELEFWVCIQNAHSHKLIHFVQLTNTSCEIVGQELLAAYARINRL